MKNPKDATDFAPLLCQRCGGLMRLIGSEPHPIEAKADLLTYSCTACEDFLVLSVSIPATGARPILLQQEGHRPMGGSESF
jgi:hypothetical protein